MLPPCGVAVQHECLIIVTPVMRSRRKWMLSPEPNWCRNPRCLPAQMADEYALGVRPSLEDAVEAVIRILGMQPCEGSDAVPPNARSAICRFRKQITVCPVLTGARHRRW